MLALRRSGVLGPALLVWVLGVELFPGLHLGFHAFLGEHHHEGDVAVHDHGDHHRRRGRDHGHGHQHGHHHHERAAGHGHARTDHDTPPQEETAPADPPGHGEHSLLHRAVATLAAAVVVVPPPVVTFELLEDLPAPAAPPQARSRHRRLARGPPPAPSSST